VDIIAEDVPDLLSQVDGRVVEAGGTNLTLDVRYSTVIPIEFNTLEAILNLLTNPNLVFLLLAIGVQALLIELSTPGGWVAGFIGVVCLSLAIYGLGLLPVNWFGVIFLVAAFVLFILDIKAPTHGALTITGSASFIAGALILFNSGRSPAYTRVSVPLVVATGVILAIIFFLVVMIAVRAMKRPVITGRESLVGKQGMAREDLQPEGIVQVAGEQWTAQLDEGEKPIHKGERVEVLKVEGVRLVVGKPR
jgi:membrane-bound serine protease (ClpP class)